MSGVYITDQIEYEKENVTAVGAVTASPNSIR